MSGMRETPMPSKGPSGVGRASTPMDRIADAVEKLAASIVKNGLHITVTKRPF